MWELSKMVREKQTLHEYNYVTREQSGQPLIAMKKILNIFKGDKF